MSIESNVSEDGGRQTKKRKIGENEGPIGATTLPDISSDNPSSNKITTELLSFSKPLTSRDLLGQHSNSSVKIIEFSDDGSLFVSGGEDGRVLLWQTDKVRKTKWTPNPTSIDTQYGGYVNCLAVSPDNKRVFSSGGWDQKLLIHDIRT